MDVEQASTLVLKAQVPLRVRCAWDEASAHDGASETRRAIDVSHRRSAHGMRTRDLRGADAILTNAGIGHIGTASQALARSPKESFGVSQLLRTPGGLIAPCRKAPPRPPDAPVNDDRPPDTGDPPDGDHGVVARITKTEKEKHMSQNIVSLSFTPAQLAAVDQALTEVESQLSGLIALTKAQRVGVPKMGIKSEAFCRQALSLLSQNPQVVPATVSLADAQADMATRDQLRPLVQRLQRLSERATDTEFALGSDVMATSLQAYALLKVAGKNLGLESLRKELGALFAKSRQSEPKAA